MIALLLLLASPPDQFAAARQAIDRYCGEKPTCVVSQRRQMGYFVNMMAAFKDPGGRNAERCMRSAKRGQYIDWVAASGCMRKAVKGRTLGR